MNDVGHKKYHHRFMGHLRTVIIAGLAVTVPIGLTIWILVWLFESIDKLLRPLTVYIFGHQVIGFGFGAVIILIFLVGLIATNVVGKKVVHWVEGLLSRVPVTRILYNALKQVMQSFTDPRKTGFMQVVLVQFPRKGIYAIGFVTNIHMEADGKKIISVFIPTSPNPTGGFLQILDESEVTYTNLTIEEGLKIVVSAGRISSDEINDKVYLAKSVMERDSGKEI